MHFRVRRGCDSLRKSTTRFDNGEESKHQEVGLLTFLAITIPLDLWITLRTSPLAPSPNRPRSSRCSGPTSSSTSTPSELSGVFGVCPPRLLPLDPPLVWCCCCCDSNLLTALVGVTTPIIPFDPPYASAALLLLTLGGGGGPTTPLELDLALTAPGLSPPSSPSVPLPLITSSSSPTERCWSSLAHCFPLPSSSSESGLRGPRTAGEGAVTVGIASERAPIPALSPPSLRLGRPGATGGVRAGRVDLVDAESLDEAVCDKVSGVGDESDGEEVPGFEGKDNLSGVREGRLGGMMALIAAVESWIRW